MRTCPRCGYVDPKQRAAGRRHDAKRDKAKRAAYQRGRRARIKAEAAAKRPTKARSR